MNLVQITTTVIVLIIIPIEVLNGNEEISSCGRRLVNHETLITNGHESIEGSWPWHAAIFHIDLNLNIAYKCGGSVITTNAILTAAHCVYQNSQPIIADRVLIELGKYNLKIISPNTQQFEAFKIIPHPNYNKITESNDIAVIRLATEARFTNYVQPICLWDSNNLDIYGLTGRNGNVIGWGYTEMDKLSFILRQAVMPIVSLATCLESNRQFFGNFLSEKTFCAGFRNGTGVCNGDSGGSMTFLDNGVYRIRGIVSLTATRENDWLCHTGEYVIFTDVAKYLPWIEEVVPELNRPQLNLGSRCSTETNEPGICTGLFDCPSILDNLKKGIRNHVVCGLKEWQPIVCCQSTLMDILPNSQISEKKCDESTSTNCAADSVSESIGLMAEKEHESPHMVTPVATEEYDSDDFAPHLRNRHNEFDWNLTKALLSSDPTNVILSPFSVELLLLLLSEAAGPDTSTHRELAAVLPSIQTLIQARELIGKVYDSILEKTSNYELQIGTKIYVDESITPRQRYAAILDAYYLTKMEKLNFHKATESAKIINDWCANITKNNIKEFVNNVDVEDAVLIMVNALYFNGYWRRPFTEKFQKSFYVTPTTQVKTSFMAVTDKFYYTESQPLNAKLLRVPYKGLRFAMTIILPNVKGRLDELIRQLESAKMHTAQWIMTQVEIRVEIPKFKFDYTSKLNDVLKDIGVRSIFTNEALLVALARGADVAGRLQVSKILQKAGIFADDHGNAVNVATEDPSRFVFDSTPKFIVDHPFIFIIEDETTGTLLFAGKVADPTSFTL